jgi:hypothetical protein
MKTSVKKTENRTQYFNAEAVSSATILIHVTECLLAVLFSSSCAIEILLYQGVCKPMKFPFDPKESREHWAMFLALRMQIESKLGTANSLNLAGFNTPCVVLQAG